MSYTNAVSERMEDLRFRNGQSQRNEFPMSGLYPMAKNGGTNQLPLPLSMLNDSRGNLTRRFTTDSARIPTLGSLAVQKRSADSQDYTQPSVRLPESWTPVVISRDHSRVLARVKLYHRRLLTTL